MNDMRQKLLPIFLEEAGRKILQLDIFIAATCGEGKSLADLEEAFRAAHTLKGTAALVQADAIRSLSGRIEGLLEIDGTGNGAWRPAIASSKAAGF